MPIKVEKLPEEAIICAEVSEPFDPKKDMPTMFAEIIQLRLGIQGDVAMILDVTNTVDAPDSFRLMMLALAEASRGIRAGRAAGVGRPPITIFVGSGPLANLASQAIEQDQYGGVRALLCNSKEDALALARSKLSTEPGR